MKLIAWWIGTDALTLIKNPPARERWYVKLFFYRLKWKFLKKYFEHWAVHENLTIYLKKFGIDAKVVVYPADYPKKIKKIKHDTFNILYYQPSNPANLGGWEYLDWYYGYDIYVLLRWEFFLNEDIKFILADGTQNDIDDIYALTDVYIRPNRWDGTPRMVQECQIKNIPYYWNDKVGKDGYLSPDVEEIKKFINNEYFKWKNDSK